MTTLATANAPILSILGNHDIDNITHEEYQEIVSKLPLNLGTVGNYQKENVEFWWINHQKINDHDCLGDTEIDTIKQQKDPSKIQCILSHYPLIIPNLNNTYYFGDHPEIAKLHNDNLHELWLDNQLPTLLLNGHLHFYNHAHKQNLHQITGLPFSDNLQSHHNSTTHPCSHTILEINDTNVGVSVFSGGYVLTREEFKLSP